MEIPLKYIKLKKIYIIQYVISTLITIINLLYIRLKFDLFNLSSFILFVILNFFSLFFYIFFIKNSRNIRWFWNYLTLFGSIPFLMLFRDVSNIKDFIFFFILILALYIPPLWIFYLYNTKEVIDWLNYNKKSKINDNLLAILILILFFAVAVLILIILK